MTPVSLPPVDDTRDRLLQAGGRIFARRGFANASVREICAKAGANVSAVNYHFGNKEGLYREVVRLRRSQICGADAPPVMQPGDEPLVALRRWVGWFLTMLVNVEANHPWIGEILAHETIEPTQCLDEFVEHTAGPVRTELVRIVRRIQPASVSDRDVGHLANFIIGMCASHKHSRHMLARFGYAPPSTAEGLHALADMMTRFAQFGLEGFASGGNTP